MTGLYLTTAVRPENSDRRQWVVKGPPRQHDIVASRDTAPYEAACVPVINPWTDRRRFWSGALHDNGLTALCVPLSLKPQCLPSLKCHPRWAHWPDELALVPYITFLNRRHSGSLGHWSGFHSSANMETTAKSQGLVYAQVAGEGVTSSDVIFCGALLFGANGGLRRWGILPSQIRTSRKLQLCCHLQYSWLHTNF